MYVNIYKSNLWPNWSAKLSHRIKITMLTASVVAIAEPGGRGAVELLGINSPWVFNARAPVGPAKSDAESMDRCRPGPEQRFSWPPSLLDGAVCASFSSPTSACTS